MTTDKRRRRNRKYKNLTRRDGIYYYERVVDGKRTRVSLETGNRDEAAAARDAYEAEMGTARFVRPDSPTFAEMAERYLVEDAGHLATRSLRSHKAHLKEGGEVLRQLGDLRVDAITSADLRDWWAALTAPYLTKDKSGKSVTRQRTAATGHRYLAAVSSVFAFAIDCGLIEGNPAAGLRSMLSRKERGKKARAATPRACPIEDPAALERIVAEAEVEGTEALVLVLLLLDAGLRLGEAAGLPWGAVVWGANANDRSRALLIEQSKPSHVREVESTKSGRARRVGLSRRLRRALMTLYREKFRPGPDTFVLAGVDTDNFRRREWRRICERARVGSCRLKDLRDTFASQLFTAGVQLGHISAQLGHAQVTTTVQHYSRWIEGTEYREAMPLEPGELPADLLARIKSPQSLPIAADG